MASAAEVARPDFARNSLQVSVTGKLTEQRFNDGVYYSVLLMASADEYSPPMPFEVRSRKSLGSRGEVVTVRCQLGGYFKRTYNVTDQNTGEIRRVRPIVLTLDAVED